MKKFPFSNQFSVKQYRIEDDDDCGSKAIGILKEKMKIYDLEKIPQLTQSMKKSKCLKSRSKSQKFYQQSIPNLQQNPQNNRVSNKELVVRSSDRCSINTLESVKSRLSIQQAKLLDVPIIKILKESHQSEHQDIQNDISLLLMEKYYQATIKYEEKKLKQNIKQINKIKLKPKAVTSITQNNQAVKNYQRKLKNSRRDFIRQLQKSNSISLSQDQSESEIKVQPTRTIFLKRNVSVKLK